MDKLGLGLLGSIVGVLAAATGFFWAWVVADVIYFGDYFNMQLLTFIYLTNPPGYPPPQKNPMSVIYSLYQLLSAIDRMPPVGGIHYTLLAATLILLSIGIYALYKIESSNRICIITSVLGIILGFVIPLLTIGTLMSMNTFPFFALLMMYAFIQIGLPVSLNIGLSYASFCIIAGIIMLLVLVMFGLSLNSVKWATADPDKTGVAAILLALSGIFSLGSAFLMAMYSYIVFSILLAVTCCLLIYIFRATQLYG
ncbi:MAG: hypothetical protein QXO71_01695 [Candidatus Jordarchaeaceae archaeon]